MPRTTDISSHSKNSGSRRNKDSRTNISTSTSTNPNMVSSSGGEKSKRGGASSRSTSRSVHTTSETDEDHPDLAALELRLTEEVDNEFFIDPRKFHTLHRVIDVLGMQLADIDNDISTRNKDLEENPAYKLLKQQQQVVEEAIEHLALIHCADLNGSVVQVGRVARQFHDAVTQVRHLRKQVSEIQETLGASNNKTSHQLHHQAATAAASAMSLRELWLKKLEAEAVLSLLDKLDRIRAAPRQFDLYLRTHRIGAAVICVAQALDTMFSSDVAQVQALHKIMEQLMMRKQTAEEAVWELLMDVLFLRTGNGPAQVLAFGGTTNQGYSISAKTNKMSSSGSASANHNHNNHNNKKDSAASVLSTDTKLVVQTSLPAAQDADYWQHQHQGMTNPFLNRQMRFALEYDLQVESLSQVLVQDNNNNMVEVQDDFLHDEEDAATIPMVIPNGTMEAEFDLESDERRHLEERTSLLPQQQQQEQKPEYMDHILALRTLVECLVRLRRLDDVERMVSDGMEQELSALVQREQARTYFRVEGSSAKQLKSSGRYAMLLAKAGATTDLRDFRKHLASIVSAFGNVQVRLTHLAQIVRHRIVRTATTTTIYYSTCFCFVEVVVLFYSSIVSWLLTHTL
jgi:hypothetical protein